MMTSDDYIMTYYDVINLCYYYRVFRRKRSKICLFSIYIQLLFYDSTLFFESILEKYLNYKRVFWTLQAF